MPQNPRAQELLDRAYAIEDAPSTWQLVDECAELRAEIKDTSWHLEEYQRIVYALIHLGLAERRGWETLIGAGTIRACRWLADLEQAPPHQLVYGEGEGQV